MYNKKQIEYSKKYNKKKNKFYVYVYLDPRKEGEFIYGEYKFNYCLIDTDKDYLIENHLICIEYISLEEE